MSLVDASFTDEAGNVRTVPEEKLAHRCESCGENKARYVVADLEEADTSLFCPPCIVLTFAKVASEIGAAG